MTRSAPTDARVAILSTKSLRQHRDGSIMLWAVNSGARLFFVFGFVALLLAVIGVYGVKSYVVSRRTREIGIRMALGATNVDVVRMVLREGLMLTVAGVGVGLLLAGVVAKALSGMLYEVSALDPTVFVVAPIVLTLAALGASHIPARRATRVVPITALRAEIDRSLTWLFLSPAISSAPMSRIPGRCAVVVALALGSSGSARTEHP